MTFHPEKIQISESSGISPNLGMLSRSRRSQDTFPEPELLGQQTQSRNR